MSVDTKYEVQRTNNFRLILDVSTFEGGYTGIIELACDSTGLPTMSNDPINLDYGNSDVKVAGKATLDDITVAVKDFIEPDVEGILWKWRLAVYNPNTGKVGWTKNYKKDGKIVQYGPNGEVLREWHLSGCWPTSLDLGDLDYSSGDKKQVSMTLSVDNAYIESIQTSTAQGRGNATHGIGTDAD